MAAIYISGRTLHNVFHIPNSTPDQYTPRNICIQAKKIGTHEVVQHIIELGVERITDSLHIASFPGGFPAYAGAGTRGGFVSRSVYA